MKIGVFLPNWIGDVAMATPMLRALRENFGSYAQLSGILRPYVAEVLAGLPWFHEIITYDKNPPVRGSLKLSKQLSQVGFDALLLLPNSFRTGAIAWLSGVPQRVGYVRYGRGPLLTDRLFHPAQNGRWTPISAVDAYLGLSEHLGCPTASKQLELRTTEVDEVAADALWKKLGLTPSAGVVAICPSGAYGAAKHWPPSYFGDLAKRIANSNHCQVLVVCGPGERQTASIIESLAAHRHVVSLAEENLSIGLTKACLRRANVVVAPDSGPRHLAAGFNVPTVALFGPTDPKWAKNYNPHEIQLMQDLDCRPCAARTCPLQHHRCMQEMTVDQVFAAVQTQLDRSHRVAAA